MNPQVYVSEVKHSTQVKSFVPFTAVTDAAGEYVAIVPITKGQYDALLHHGSVEPLVVLASDGTVVV